MPSTFCDPSFSFRRLRTTPARNPRTECCCQPVAFIMTAIVAPAGDCSIAITRACFEPEAALLLLGGAAGCCEGVAVVAVDKAADRCFADFDMRSSIRLSGFAPHHRSPISAIKPAGRDLGAPLRARNGHTTALSGDECQSFLDNVIADLGQFG